MLVSNEETWLALFALGIENPQLFTTLNVMGGFFLLFDVTMDIFHGKFTLGQSGHTHHANYPFSTVKVSRVTAPIVKLFYEKTYRTVRHARIQSNWFKLRLFKQLWNLTFRTFGNDVWNIETSSNAGFLSLIFLYIHKLN